MATETIAPITSISANYGEDRFHGRTAQTKSIPALEVARAEEMMRCIYEQFEEETSDAERAGTTLPSAEARDLAIRFCERLVNSYGRSPLHLEIYISFTPSGGIHIGLYSKDRTVRIWFSVDPSGSAIKPLTGAVEETVAK
ncbi:MAG: hypothetical protein D6724_06410 [Armatimonadetes bacterium]|nr:MAG: hypothetical protein D6724_06410 [Armatimonadota bacterium]